MWSSHPRTKLTPYLRGELSGGELDAVSNHVLRCAECRRTAETFDGILSELRESVPASPEVNWDRYRVELREKLRQRVTQPQAGWYRQLRLMSAAALCASIAGLLILFAVRGSIRPSAPTQDLNQWQEAMIGSQLELLENYPVVERLDLLENLDVIQALDEPSSVPRGANGA